MVYAPCCNHSIHVYRTFVDTLQTLISAYAEISIVIVIGDLNVHRQGQGFIKATYYRAKYLVGM